MADGTHGTGPNNSGGESGNSSGMSAEDIEKRINDAVSKALGARMKRVNFEEQIASAVEKAIESRIAGTISAKSEAVEPSAGGPETPERLNLKAVDQRIKTMEAELQRERAARADAEKRATQERLTSALQNAFSKHAGPDNPHLPAYLNHYANQFRVADGQVYRVQKDEFGQDQLQPLDTAAAEMFAPKGELAHLVPSKSPNLPPASLARGYPMASGNGEAPRLGIFEREILHSRAMSDPSMHEQLYGPKKPQ